MDAMSAIFPEILCEMADEGVTGAGCHVSNVAVDEVDDHDDDDGGVDATSQQRAKTCRAVSGCHFSIISIFFAVKWPK